MPEVLTKAELEAGVAALERSSREAPEAVVQAVIEAVLEARRVERSAIMKRIGTGELVISA